MATRNKQILKTVKATASAGVMSIVAGAIEALKVTTQSLTQLEARLHEAALSCLQHAEKTGDIMPMQRLLQGMAEHPHPLTKGLVAEINAYMKKNSPMRANTKGEVKLLKEGDEGYTPFDLSTAETEPFFEMKAAKAARQAANTAHRNKLQALTFKDVLGRVKGIAKTVERADEPDANGDTRGVAKADKPKIKQYLSDLEAFNRDWFEKQAIGKAA